MLEFSFVHLPGIGSDTEQRLWSQGCCSWDELEVQIPELFGKQKSLKLLRALDESRAAIETEEFSYFHRLFKGGERWRLASALVRLGQAHRIAYLDIESTGLGFPPVTESTTIAVWFDGELAVEHSPELKKRLLEKIQKQAKLLVTFNGTSFDLPFLRREFDLELSQPHVDLRYWFARLGFTGGLKAIQTRFPEVRQRASMDIDGFDAVRLWSMHQKGIPRALETLMTYNAEDTIVLEQLLHAGLNQEAQSKPFLKLSTYPIPVAPPIATQVCPKVYRTLRGY